MSDPTGGDEPEVEIDNPSKTKLKDTELSAEQQVIESGKVMAAVAYAIWPLSYLAAKDNAFVRYHLRQGGVVFAIAIGAMVLWFISWFLPGVISTAVSCVMGLLSLGVLIFALIGVFNAIKGAKEPLPLIGGLEDKLPLDRLGLRD